MTGPCRFGVVGSGWRAQFFARLAQAAPDRLELVGAQVRTDEAESRLAPWGVRTVRTAAELLALAPDFVATAVPWPENPVVIRELVGLGVKVLAETPPAPDLAGLRALWAVVGSSGLVQVAEQYTRMPGHAARLAVVGEGVIGTPNAVEVHSTHLYHAVSLARAYLGVGLADVRVSGRRFTAPLVDPLTPRGWRAETDPVPRTTTLATLDFGDGRYALYDFVENQWWNPLLARRLVVRGSHGEIVDDAVTRWTADGAVTSPVVYRRTGVDMNLEGNEVVNATFDGRVVWRNPFVGTRLSEDDLAVADHLVATGAWARGEGPEPYPLAEGCQDHAIALAIEASARTGEDVTAPAEPWTDVVG
jgi:predicted dehydrogenase